MTLQERLAAIRKSNEIKSKPFPAWALFILYIKSHPEDTYCNHFNGLHLLIEWLGPIELSQLSEPLPPLHTSYELQQIAVILGTTIENANHSYITALNIMELTKENGYTPTLAVI